MMFLLRQLQTTRGVFSLLVFFWCSFALIWWRKDETELPAGVEQQLFGKEAPEIVSWISERVVELPLSGAFDCSDPRLKEPFVIRGLAKEWPALQKWNFDWIQEINTTADVLVSSSLTFTFYNLKKGGELLRTQGLSAVPAVMTPMNTYEAIQRMRKGNTLENLFYGRGGDGQEYYYIRFNLDKEMESDIRLMDGMLKCYQSQPVDVLRLWVSVKGSISPMHWDGQYSCLVQIYGSKRMLFYGPEHINVMGTYPQSHLLWRRAKFDPTNPDYKYFPEAKDIGGRLAIVHPGDAVCFPGHWLHYTDSLTHSISLSMRYTL